MTAEVAYVDGSVQRAPAGLWRTLRSDGVDWVVVSNATGPSTFSGHSAYWLYREGDVWVAGQASFHYSRVIPPEVLFLPDGTQGTRAIDYVPDLPHSAIKLGWWLPGTTGRPI